MTIQNNINFIREIEKYLQQKMPIRLGINKKSQLSRLIYEICRANDLSLEDVARKINIDKLLEEGKGELYHRIKRELLEIRYPSIEEGDDPHIMPLSDDMPDEECHIWDFDIQPKKIFIEESVKGLKWTDDFTLNFPGADILAVNDIKDGIRSLRGSGPVKLYNERCDNIFVIRNRSAFVKVCPCAKDVVRCGYTILNLGFGCAIDCSYCYLQLYSNSPGLVFPANIEDYYPHIIEFDSKVRGKTRIGTGEFTDSLYLDRYTKYSSYLVPFFKDMKNLVLELKTKTGDIDNVLRQEPHDNVVISWSMNTRDMAEKYEKGGLPVEERINAARQVVEKGFKIGFHFDPIVYYKGWEEDYRDIVEELFTHKDIARNTVWISLGTLRYTPGVKQIAEKRFADNKLYYCGDFFTGIDGKLRYPRDLRVKMYNNMIGWIKSFCTPAWIYLCMEPGKVWRNTDLKRRDYSFR